MGCSASDRAMLTATLMVKPVPAAILVTSNHFISGTWDLVLEIIGGAMLINSCLVFILHSYEKPNPLSFIETQRPPWPIIRWSRVSMSRSFPACTMARVTATSSGLGVGSEDG